MGRCSKCSVGGWAAIVGGGWWLADAFRCLVVGWGNVSHYYIFLYFFFFGQCLGE